MSYWWNTIGAYGLGVSGLFFTIAGIVGNDSANIAYGMACLAFSKACDVALHLRDVEQVPDGRSEV